jgi:AmiR/NasT family two-component response regulator
MISDRPTTPTVTTGKKLVLPDSPKRILVADDEFLVAAQLTHALASLGHVTVGPAVDGEAAVSLARSSLPDLCMLDVRMPKRDGISAAKEIYDELGIPVMIISAYSDDATVAAAKDSGVFGYLVKPASVDQLRASIAVAWKVYTTAAALASENGNLRRRLEERRLIEKAKWVLVSRRNITEPEAMSMLQKKARDSRRSLSEIAQAIIDAEELLSPEGGEAAKPAV